MTISNNTVFNMTSSEIISAALRKLAVLGDGGSPTTTQVTDGMTALNAMLQTFTTKGMPLWVMSEYQLTQTNTDTYAFGLGQTINIPAPLKVTQVIRKAVAGVHSVPLNVVSHYDFNLLPPTSGGTPISYWYEPLNQKGVLHLWPKPDAQSIANDVLVLVYQKPFSMMVSNVDTLDFPPWWHEAVIYGLASRLAPDFGIPLQDRSEYRQLAEQFLNEALSFGTEEGSMFIQPDWNF